MTGVGICQSREVRGKVPLYVSLHIPFLLKIYIQKDIRTARGLDNVFYIVIDICKSLSFSSDAMELSNRKGALCCTASHLPLDLSADNLIGPGMCN
jgi:hypothetical protein